MARKAKKPTQGGLIAVWHPKGIVSGYPALDPFTQLRLDGGCRENLLLQIFRTEGFSSLLKNTIKQKNPRKAGFFV